MKRVQCERCRRYYNFDVDCQSCPHCTDKTDEQVRQELADADNDPDLKRNYEKVLDSYQRSVAWAFKKILP